MTTSRNVDPNAWGLWSRDVDRAERIARLRALGAFVSLLVGSGHPLIDMFRIAEGDEKATTAALRAFDQLPALTQRRILSSYLMLHKPRRERLSRRKRRGPRQG